SESAAHARRPSRSDRKRGARPVAAAPARPSDRRSWRRASPRARRCSDQWPAGPAPPVLLGIEARRVGAPHLVRARGGDRAGVGGVAVWRTETPRGQQLMHAGQPQDALAADREAAMRQAGAHLPIAFAVERPGREYVTDGLDDLDIADRRP